MNAKIGMMAMAMSLLGGIEAHAYVKFCNQTNQNVWVAYLNHDHACGSDCGQPWEKAGWWGMSPGQCKVVYGGEAHYNRYHYFYAESDRGLKWEGPYRQEVWNSAFRSCTCLSHTGERGFTVGFREFNVGGNDNYTINLRG
jgi:uncharacterized membrane protein